MSELKRTPLFDVYKSESKLVPFGGWEMPVQFAGIQKEHDAVRNHAGLFDVSHMGEVEVSGPDALAFVQRITTNDASKLQIGDAQYALMCYPDGGTVDDLLVYRVGEEKYLLVINAGNIDKDVAWMEENKAGNMTLKNISVDIAQLALQGPVAEKVLQKLTDTDLSAIGFFKFKSDVEIAGVKALVSRSGYTGEDGFEVYFPAEHGATLWNAILEAGKEDGVIPCGLGARDTLRFEAKLPLYGQELSSTISPIEAGMGFAVKLDKGDFIGRDALAKQKAEGAPRKLVGIEMIDRGIPRSHYPVYVGDQQVGEVTTGTQSPTFKTNIGLALIETAYTQLDQVIEVEIRGKRLKAKVVKTPFYKRAK